MKVIRAGSRAPSTMPYWRRCAVADCIRPRSEKAGTTLRAPGYENIRAKWTMVPPISSPMTSGR